MSPVELEEAIKKYIKINLKLEIVEYTDAVEWELKLGDDRISSGTFTLGSNENEY